MSMTVWIAFNLFVLVLLALDLGVFHRNPHAISFKEAMKWTIFWIVISLLFNVGVYYMEGSAKALEFLTGYLIEKSLSIDNIFVFLAIFTSFKIAPRYQHKVLFWGILGALICRGLFIAVGVTLIQKFQWVTYLLGAGLIFAGIKMAIQKEESELSPTTQRLLGFLRKIIPVTDDHGSGKFVVRVDGRRMATTLLLVLLLIEASDVVFALDSIPAVLAVSHDPFIVYTSNVFAILGLRALYFALAGLLPKFHLLHYAIALIILWVGVKMIVSGFFHIPVVVTLGAVVVLLAGAVIGSLVWPAKPAAEGK